MDNDTAGYQGVWRTLEREINNLESPSDADLSIQFAYKVYVGGLTELELKGELMDLLLTEPDGKPSWKAEACLDEFDYRYKTGKYEDKTSVYKEALA